MNLAACRIVWRLRRLKEENVLFILWHGCKARPKLL
jgi:hypothetical protein